jgi:hypothetical protein
MPRKKAAPPTINDYLPEDVVEILQTITPNKSVIDGIIQLTRSYFSIMEEQGQGSDPIPSQLPPSAAALGETPLDTNAPPPDMPSHEEVSSFLSELTQPRGSLVEVRMRVHDKSLPRGSDGLVNSDYILACGAPIVESLLHDPAYTEETFTLRFTAIREVLSSLPEDTWTSGANIPTLVDRAYDELLKGRRPIGMKT